MNEIALREDFLVQLKELEALQSVCSKLLQTKHYAQMGEAGIHAIVSRAKSLGIHPFQALNGGFHCINGKIGMSTEMMNALIRKNGHSVTKDPNSNENIVILHGKRADNGDKWTCSFSKQDAINAGLWSTATWKKYPAVMLFNRCMSMLFRQLFPDLSLGAGYVKDELDEIAKVGDYKNLPVADFEIKSAPQKGVDHFVGINELVDIVSKASTDHIAQPLELVETPMTTDIEWKQFNDILVLCSEKFQQQILARLTSLDMSDLTNMDMQTFDKSKKAMLEHIAKHKKVENAPS